MKTCIYCGSQNKKHKSNCKQCGAPLPIQESTGVILPRLEPLGCDLICQVDAITPWSENIVLYGLYISGFLLIMILILYGMGIIY